MKNLTFKTELITNYMNKNHLSKTAFCKLCRVHPRIFNKIMAHDLHFGIKALFRICRVLKIEVYEFFIEPQE